MALGWLIIGMILGVLLVAAYMGWLQTAIAQIQAAYTALQTFQKIASALVIALNFRR